MIGTVKKCGILALAMGSLIPLPQRAAAATLQHTPTLDTVAAVAKREGTLNIAWSGSSIGGAKALVLGVPLTQLHAPRFREDLFGDAAEAIEAVGPCRPRLIRERS